MATKIKSIINEKNINKADVVFLSAPYEKTASSHKGTIAGPKAVIECLESQIEFFDRKLKLDVIDYLKIGHQNLNNIKNLSPEQTFAQIKKAYENLLENNKFVFLLGGEHSVCIGAFDALSKKYNSKDVTIIQIDAHCDLRSDDSDYNSNPTPYAHSAVMRRASEMGFPLVQVGIRTYHESEYKFFSNKKNNITVFEWGHPAKKPEIADILKSIKTKNIYITIDVDGFDPSVMPGTGTPVPGGLRWNYGMKLLEQLIEKYNLVGADIVEVSPQKETVITEYTSAQLAYSMITAKFKNKLK